MKVYLAGKIAANDWRHTVVSGLTNECASREFEPFATRWALLPRSVFDVHDYVGPFFMPCGGHGAGHGANTHGNGVGTFPTFDEELQRQRTEVALGCLTAIASCDLFFAWIDDNDIDCYGTLVEIGYASALRKRIVIAGTGVEEIDDMWFAHIIADTLLPHQLNPIDAARLAILGPNYHEYIRSDEWKDRADAAKARALYRCQICYKHRNEITLDAHHRTYDRLGYEKPEDITVLCRECHELYETHKKLPRPSTPNTSQKSDPLLTHLTSPTPTAAPKTRATKP